MQNLPIMNSSEAQKLPGVLLWHASKLWQQHLNRALYDLGLSSTNAVILCNTFHLQLEHKIAAQTEIARLSGVDPMTTSTALRTLQKKGLIVRQQGKKDRRAQQISLTSSGEKIAASALERIAVTHEAFFEVLRHEGTIQQLVTNLELLNSKNKLQKGL